MGIDCDCSTKNNYKDCVHSSTISDVNFIKLVTKVIDVNEKSTTEQLSFIDEMSEEYLRTQVEDCTHYEADIFSVVAEQEEQEVEKPVKRVKKRLLQM